MNLIKKTVVLTDESAEGYVSIIRVGNDVGAKIVGKNFRQGMQVGLKVGNSSPTFALLDGETTEITLPDFSFLHNDNIGCVVADGEKLVARGGMGVKLSDVIEHFSKKEEVLVSQPLVATTDEEEEEKEEEEKPLSPEEEEEKLSFLKRLSSPIDGDFYKKIRDQIEELFVIHPKENFLSALIPDSEWIKIYYEKEDYYVVGKLKEYNRTVLIGYGVPSKSNATPPKVALGTSSFLPVEGISPYDGYWLLFQDADSGKIIPTEQ